MISININRISNNDQLSKASLISESYPVRINKSSYMKNRNPTHGREKDEMELATNWRRAYYNIY